MRTGGVSRPESGRRTRWSTVVEQGTKDVEWEVKERVRALVVYGRKQYREGNVRGKIRDVETTESFRGPVGEGDGNIGYYTG